jgi:muramoyltetrapeptide carboxypeptidase
LSTAAGWASTTTAALASTTLAAATTAGLAATAAAAGLTTTTAALSATATLSTAAGWASTTTTAALAAATTSGLTATATTTAGLASTTAALSATGATTATALRTELLFRTSHSCTLRSVCSWQRKKQCMCHIRTCNQQTHCVIRATNIEFVPVKHFRRVKPLESGARIALIAPAGPLQKPEELARAQENARTFGWEPIVALHARDRTGYLAGHDRDRLNDINVALRDPNIDGIWCLRGGYGMIRILADIDYDALSRTPKAIIGYSDITALHAAVQRKCRLVTYHGPTAREPLSELARDSFERAVVKQTDSCGTAPKAREINAGTAEGRLVGGNLAVLASLCGTPFIPDLSDGILILEDINEPVYRIDRMLQQLRLSGALTGCKAIVFGECVKCSDDAGGGGRGFDEVLGETAHALGVPCMAGIPVGHIDAQWTIPLGATATLDTKTRTLAVTSYPS